MPRPVLQPSARPELLEPPLKSLAACLAAGWKQMLRCTVELRLRNQIAPCELARNHEFLSGPNLVRVLELVPVRCKDSVVVVRITVKLSRNLRQRVTRLHLVCTAARRYIRRCCCGLRR